MDLPKSDSYLIDSNLLVYSIHQKSPYHKKTRDLFNLLVDKQYKIYICTQNILEAWRVLTHSKFPHPLDDKHMKKAVKIWLKSFKLIHEDKSVWAQFLLLKDKHKPKGNAVFDLWLAAAMQAHGIDTILTLNTKDFEQIEKIQYLNPLQ